MRFAIPQRHLQSNSKPMQKPWRFVFANFVIWIQTIITKFANIHNRYFLHWEQALF